LVAHDTITPTTSDATIPLRPVSVSGQTVADRG
jgi:hypothetical protein